MGRDDLLAVDGTSFLLTDRGGDILGGTDGLFERDTRLLSRWALRVDGQTPVLLTSHHVDPYSGLIFLMNASGGTLPPNSVSIQRSRAVGGGMEERILLRGHLEDELRFDLRVDIEADFLDLFEVKEQQFLNPGDRVFGSALGDRPTDRNVVATTPGEALAYGVSRGGFKARLGIRAEPAGVPGASGLSWRVSLPPRGSFEVVLRVGVSIAGELLPRRHRIDEIGVTDPASPAPGLGLARLSTPWSELEMAHRHAMTDLATLAIDEPGLAQGLPAAGLPWFMTVFGRDTLLTALQLLPAAHSMGWAAVETLAGLQATTDDPARDAEPGKIVHELRRGPAARTGGNFPYYGSVDAPLLFVVLLSELWRWGRDDARARRFRGHAEAALDWAMTRADVDQDGFVEWVRRCPTGLANQAWKDSWDAYRRRDGTLAEGPLASAEVQGYAFDALTRAAELAEGPWQDPDLARRYRDRAASLMAHFNDAFWSGERDGFYHLALDGQKQPVDSLTSNMGHLLWSGIVPPERAGAVAAQLMSPRLFSGWGIRTMGSGEGGYNPISYHCGTVWPHDNSIAVAGLHRYGFHAEANRLFEALVESAVHFKYRLPEVFGGYDRAVAPFPIEYPTASSPQAWACGALPFMLRSALGLQPGPAGTISLDPHLPSRASELRLLGLSASGRGFDVEVTGGAASISEH